jgi:solute carrier family 27 fatty acid transporter 1/4
MLVGLISSSNAIRDFHGYVDKQASSRKILHNVFKRGDRAFLTGEYKMTTVRYITLMDSDIC